MKSLKKKVKTAKRTRLDLETASQYDVLNDLIEFMINNRNRNSATRSEVKHYFNCSFNKATRILHGAVMMGKVKTDHEVDDLYWLVIE